MTVADVTAELSGATDERSVREAVRRAIDKALLQDEATRHLSPDVAASPDASRTLLETLFSPNDLCKRFPEDQRRGLYQSALWRFQMPPAWQVSAIDWLCCSGAACEHPDTASCRAEGLAYMSRLKQELPERLSDTDFGDIFDSLRPEQPRLRFERYTFFHDPSDLQGTAHRRLRRAEGAISKPVSAMTVGAITGPITTQRGVTLVRLRGARPAVHLLWEDPRTQAALRTELCPARVTKARRQYLSDLRTQVPLSIDQVGIESRWGVQLTPTQPR